MSDRQPRFRLVFTPFGGAVLAVAMAGLIRALLNRNAYEIVIASAVLFLMLILGILGFWKSKKLKSMETGWKTPSPMTAFSDEETFISGLADSIPLFFRLHFFIKGVFFPNGDKNSCRVKAETSVARGETSANIPFNFPMSGIFQGEGFCRLCDIFGFFSFSCGMMPQSKTVNVRSAPCYGKKTQINAVTGAEDQRNKPAADVERYYMREYTPGDRFRDINWKSSDKIDTLITRISTDNQEKVSRIEIYFRNFGPVCAVKTAFASMEPLWLLDRAKARLSYFLRNLMEQNSSFILDVRAARGSWEIQNMDELELFLDELAELSFLPLQNESALNSSNSGDIYIFSTACDTALPGYILACNPRPVTLFLVQPGDIKNTPEEQKANIEVLKSDDFLQRGCSVSFRRFRKGIKFLGAHANRVEMFYAEIKA